MTLGKYCPGPAVGGGTSLAVVGAYVLAGELATAGGDHVRDFRVYERELGNYVRCSRAFALGVAKRLIPDSRSELWAQPPLEADPADFADQHRRGAAIATGGIVLVDDGDAWA